MLPPELNEQKRMNLTKTLRKLAINLDMMRVVRAYTEGQGGAGRVLFGLEVARGRAGGKAVLV